MEVTQEDPDSSLRLCSAVLDAYMARAGGQDARQSRMRRDTLEAHRKALLKQLETQEHQIETLAGEYGTSNETTFAEMRKNIEQVSLQTRQELERTRRDIIVLQQRLQSVGDASILPEELRKSREQLIENDAGVRWVKGEMMQEQARLSRLMATIPAGSKIIKDAQQELEQASDCA